MKKGFMFFLNLHNYIKIARICLIPAALFLFFARGVLLMTVALILIGILLLISLIRAPRTRTFSKGSNSFMKNSGKECPLIRNRNVTRMQKF